MQVPPTHIQGPGVTVKDPLQAGLGSPHEDGSLLPCPGWNGSNRQCAFNKNALLPFNSISDPHSSHGHTHTHHPLTHVSSVSWTLNNVSQRLEGGDFREAIQLAGGKEEWVELYLHTHGPPPCTLTLHPSAHPPSTHLQRHHRAKPRPQ